VADLGFDPTGAPLLRRGGGPADWVTFLQQALTAAGFNPGAADGDFGPATQQAVEAFQTAAGLGADGIVGDATWLALAQALGPVAATGNRFDPATAPVLRRGSRGEFVAYLQQLLIAAGHDPGPVDGIFGPRTEAAVREFQQANGLQVDGVVGIQTWTALDPIAEAHPTDPPVGTPVQGGGGGAPAPGGTAPGGTIGDPRVTVIATPDSTIGDDGNLRVAWVISNATTGFVRMTRLEREVLGEGGSISGARELNEVVAGGESLTVDDTVPMGRAPDGETFVITIASVVVFDVGDGVERRSPENLEAFTIDDRGNVTPGGAAPPSGGGPTTAGDHLTVSISPAERVVDGSLQIDFPTSNVSTVNTVISGLDWSVQSGSDQLNRQGDQGAPLGPGEAVTLSDVTPMGPAADEPFAITITATVTYFLDNGTELRSAPAQKTVTIDAQGVVGGSAGGGGSGDLGTPRLRLDLDVFSVDNVLGCNAAVTNDGDGLADDVNLSGTLSGAFNDHKERLTPTLGPTEGSVVELGVQLPADRTDTLLFVFEAQVTSSNAAGAFDSTGISVAPDGTINRG
jgi:peptidoglycan hydrolase-like protein with peptidoglycan-binding domain